MKKISNILIGITLIFTIILTFGINTTNSNEYDNLVTSNILALSEVEAVQGSIFCAPVSTDICVVIVNGDNRTEIMGFRQGGGGGSNDD